MAKMKSYIWISVIVLILIGLMAWGVKSSSTIEPSFEINTIHPLDNVKGNKEAKVVIVEYSDFQCPACRAYYLMMREIEVAFGDQIAFVYRHFPLNQIHNNAELAARAAQAAAKQDKFWEMYSLLFEKQDEWSKVANIEPLFESYAKLLNLDTEKFKADFESKEIRSLVRVERQSAMNLDLKGTPTFFINGKKIENPSSVEAFKILINQALVGK